MLFTTYYRRWFCDGVAQFVSETTVRQFCGQTAYNAIHDSFDPQKLKIDPARVDLLGWRAVESETCMPITPGLYYTDGYYACAVQEIRDLTQRYGPDTVAKTMKRMASIPLVKRDSYAILMAIKGATGADITGTLSSHGANANDSYRGIALTQVALKVITVGDKRVGAPLNNEHSGIRLDGKHDVQLDCCYERLEPGKPVILAFAMVDTDDTYRADTNLVGKGPGKATLRLGLPKSWTKIMPGSYQLIVAVNNVLRSSVHVTVSNAQ